MFSKLSQLFLSFIVSILQFVSDIIYISSCTVSNTKHREQNIVIYALGMGRVIFSV